MIKKITFFLLLTLSLNTFSQKKIKGNGLVSVVKTDLNDFKKLSINNDFEVVLIKSSTPSIEIETDENIHEAIKFYVSDSVFTLDCSSKLKPKKTFNITIFCTEKLTEIELNNNAKLETINTLNFSSMALEINNYAKADVTIKSDDFKFISNSQSKIQLRPKSKLDIESKLINFDIEDASSTEAIVRTDSLTLNLKDKGSLEIQGNTETLNIAAIGHSKVKGKNLVAKKSFVVVSDDASISTQTFDDILSLIHI